MLGGARCGALPAEAPKRDARDATLLLGLPAPLTGLLMLLKGALILSRLQTWRPNVECLEKREARQRTITKTRSRGGAPQAQAPKPKRGSFGERSRRAGGVMQRAGLR